MSISTLYASSGPEFATSVLRKIYNHTGNFSVRLPEIQIRDSKQFMAAYSPDRNIIYLEETALNVCRSFGRDSAIAIAFLLSHELSHAFQQVGWATNFVSYDQQENSSIQLEKSADLQGAMGAILAGFDIRPIVRPLLDRLYDVYNLGSNVDPWYPSLENRQATAVEVTEKANELWHLYQTANYLNVVEQHQMAASIYEYILQHYIGKEIYNNLGLQYAKLAMHFSGKYSDPFIFPFEIETESRISLARAEDLTPEEMKIRKQYLLAAETAFNKALDLDQEYLLAKINALCVSIQLGKYQELIEAYESQTLAVVLGFLGSNSKEVADLNIAIGIAYALSGQSNKAHLQKATAIFDELSLHPNDEVRRIAIANNSILNGEKLSPPQLTGCPSGLKTGNNLDGVSLFSLIGKNGRSIDGEGKTEFYFEELPHSVVQVICHQGTPFPLQRIVKSGMAMPGSLYVGQHVDELFARHEKLDYIIIPAGEKYFLHFQDCRMILLVGPNGNIQEWAKYLN